VHTHTLSPSLGERLRRPWRPAVYQGMRSKGYFEGWYFKCVDATRDTVVAIIPGISLPEDGDPHSFVQVLASGGHGGYHLYPVERFAYDADRFSLRVGPNRFDRKGMHLELEDPFTVEGDVSFGPWSEWPVTATAPGAMGWYRFVPFMECYHGILSMDHGLTGGLRLGDREVDLDGGRGYAEKDWGRSFPREWLWVQTNHFSRPGTSVSLSVARVPWLTSAFVGHLCGLLHEGVLYRFTTYRGSRIDDLASGGDWAEASLSMGDLRLRLRVDGVHPGQLRSPVMGDMRGEVLEALDAKVHVTLERSGQVLLDDEARPAAAELMDPDRRLVEQLGHQ
jgi:tocopherol cyclase